MEPARNNEYTLPSVTADELKTALHRSEHAQAVILSPALFRYLAAQAVFGACTLPVPLIRVADLKTMLGANPGDRRVALDFETFSDMALQAIAAMEAGVAQNHN